MKAALYSTEIPKVKGAMLDGGEADIILSDDIYESMRLDATNFPVFVTLCKVKFIFVIKSSKLKLEYNVQ